MESLALKGRVSRPAPRPAPPSLVAAAGAALLVAAPFALLFAPTLAGLASQWSGEYARHGHGFLLAAAALWIAARTRVPPRRSRGAGALLLGVGIALFLAGTLMAEVYSRRVAALVVVAGLVAHYRGVGQLRTWWLPFALLLVSIPLPSVVLSTLTLPLQLFASEAAVGLLGFRHIPAEVAGNIIFLPGHQLFVAEACSGLRSIAALFGVGLLIAGTTLGTVWGRIGLLAVVVPAALLANLLRVFVTGYGVYVYGPGVAEGMLHSAIGLSTFGLALGLVGIAALVLRKAGA